jgi:hypothetical protein
MRKLLVSALLAIVTLAGLALPPPAAHARLFDRFRQRRFAPPVNPGYSFYPPPTWPGVPVADASFIVSLYRSILGREPGWSEVNAWLQRLNDLRGNRSRLVESFQRAARVELSQQLVAPVDDASFIVSLYRSILGREPGWWEMNAWLQRLNDLRGNRSTLVEDFQRAARVELSQRPPWQR